MNLIKPFIIHMNNLWTDEEGSGCCYSIGWTYQHIITNNHYYTCYHYKQLNKAKKYFNKKDTIICLIENNDAVHLSGDFIFVKYMKIGRIIYAGSNITKKQIINLQKDFNFN